MRLVAFAVIVVAALVVGIVLASGGGPGEGASEPPVAATPTSPEANTEPSVAADVAESTPPEPTTLRYNRLDISGAATAAGSYAFLQTAGDAASAIDTFEYGYSGVVELRIHPTDASGTSRAVFYDTVHVGDSFDYRTKGLDCGFRFKVTSIATAATPRTFGIEYGRSFGGWCDDAVGDASGAKPVQFVWRVLAGVPGPGGGRVMLAGEAVGPGTYRVSPSAPWTFDVPPGMTVFHYGPALNSSGGVGVMLIDVATDSRLGLDWKTGRETRRVIKSPELSALFDQIMASIRRVDGATSPPEPVTLRYNLLDITGAATAAGSYAFLQTAGDAASAIGNFGYSASGSAELRIHPADASGTSRAAFYDTVAVGDSFDYRTNGLDCAFRFKVTRVGARANPLTLGIEYVRGYGGRCGGPVDDPGAAKDVYFVWKVRGGIPAPDGIRVLLYGEPVGEGTYRLAGQVPYVIDVPASSVIVSDGIIEHEPQPDDSGRPSATVLLFDGAMSSGLHIDPETGREVRRFTSSADADALFDQIIASIRRVDGPASPPEPVSLRYNRLDISGAATAAGSYAFLKTAGDATSAIENFGNRSTRGVELRVHSTDASGASRAGFYDTVQVGDSFDYRTNGLDCGYRFKVTSVPTAASPRTFGIEYVRRYGGRCSTTVDDPTAARDVHFVWKVPAGVPGPDGVREMLPGEAVGPGTYRLHAGWAWVIDVPAGMQLIQDGTRILEPAADAPANAPRIVLVLLDAATGSLLGINPETGGELGRQVTSVEVGALFDQIMASIRRVE